MAPNAANSAIVFLIQSYLDGLSDFAKSAKQFKKDTAKLGFNNEDFFQCSAGDIIAAWREAVPVGVRDLMSFEEVDSDVVEPADESDSDSSESSAVVESSSAVVESSAAEDSSEAGDSDSDSGDDESAAEEQTVIITEVPTAAPVTATGKKRKMDDRSDSSSASSSESDDSSNDSDSDSSEDEAPPAKKIKTEVIVPATLVDIEALESSGSESGSESEDSSESEDDAESDGSDASESDSDSDEDSQDDVKEPTTKPSKTKTAPANQDANSDSDDSDSASESSASESDSDSDSESDSGSDSSIDGEVVHDSSILKITRSPGNSSPELPDSSSSSVTLVASPPKPKDTLENSGIHPDRQRNLPGGAAVAAVVDAKNGGGKKRVVPFSRIPADQKIDPRLASNAFHGYDYAQQAHEKLIVTKGKGFTKAKNKGKRGSYRGGKIENSVHSFKFDD